MPVLAVVTKSGTGYNKSYRQLACIFDEYIGFLRYPHKNSGDLLGLYFYFNTFNGIFCAR